MENYIINTKIFRGMHGGFYRAKDRFSGDTVLLKKVSYGPENQGIPIAMIREINLLKNLKHPNIVELLSVILDFDKLTMIFEYLSANLYTVIANRSEKLDPKLVKSYLHQLCTAVDHCHTKNILHRNLMSENLLLDSTGILKVTDFRLASASSIPIRETTEEPFAFWYAAPEILLGSNIYTSAVDIWSIGCIFAEMLQNAPVFTGDNVNEHLLRIFRILTTPNKTIWPGLKRLPKFRNQFPEWTVNKLNKTINSSNSAAMDLLQQTFIYDPSKRISATQMLKHEYFNGFDNTEYYRTHGTPGQYYVIRILHSKTYNIKMMHQLCNNEK